VIVTRPPESDTYEDLVDQLEFYEPKSPHHDALRKNIVGYISGFVAKKVDLFYF
jgi:hypothetical protein